MQNDIHSRTELKQRVAAWDQQYGKDSRETARLRAATERKKAQAAAKRKNIRDGIILAPFAGLLIVMSAVMVVVMAVLLPVFLVVALLRPVFVIGGFIAAVVGFFVLIGGGSPAVLIVGLIALFLGLFVRVTSN